MEAKHIRLDEEQGYSAMSQDTGLELSSTSVSNSQAQPDSDLIIILQNGEKIQIRLTQEFRNALVSEVKKIAFPQQTEQGLSISLIYQGRLIKDQERLNDLNFVGSLTVHAVMWNSNVQNPEQQQPIQLENGYSTQVPLAQNQQLIQNGSTESEGTDCDFWFGFFMALILELIGLLIVCCCKQPKKAKKGATIGFIIRVVASFIYIYANKDELYSK